MSDLDFWVAVRAALIMFVRAIEKKYSLRAAEFAEMPMPIASNGK